MTQQGAAAIAVGAAVSPQPATIDPATAAIAAAGSIYCQNPATNGVFSNPNGNTLSTRQKVWSGLGLGSYGDWFPTSDLTAITIQVEGVFGSGGYVNIEGSIDGKNTEVLKDPSGNALKITSKGLYSVGSIASQMRPNIPAGDSTTNLTVSVLARPYFA